MDAVQRQLLLCLRAYRKGIPTAQSAEELAPEDWDRLHTLAVEQKLTAAVYDTLWRTEGFCRDRARLAAEWKGETLLESAAQAVRSRRIVEISAKFREEALPHAVVKGILCREMYTKPDLRPSGDEDLVILPRDLERAAEILRAMGLETVEHAGGQGVTHFHDPATELHLELHTCLFPGERQENQMMNTLMTNQLALAEPMAVTGGEIMALPAEAHFIFLIAHALKHFASCGVGVRTLCDVVQFASLYEEKINKDRVCRTLEEIHGLVFFQQILLFGQQWLEFPADSWELTVPSDIETLLQDSLEGGIYGHSSESRKHGATLAQTAMESGGEGKALARSIFPRMDAMKARYPVLERCPLLLPGCWLHRMGKYAWKVLCTGADASPAESIREGKKRREMMVRYGVLPKDTTKN